MRPLGSAVLEGVAIEFPTVCSDCISAFDKSKLTYGVELPPSVPPVDPPPVVPPLVEPPSVGLSVGGVVSGE